MTSQSNLVGSPVRTCTTTCLTVCEVTELTSVVTYTFTVVARNAVGAGTASAVSNAVTPRGALTRIILITGTGAPGTRTVDAKGDFSWQRQSGKRIVVEFRTGDITSNRAVIAAR